MTLMVRLEIDRQKLSVALQLLEPPPMHWLNVLIEPLMTTWLGFWPRPATSV